jgi:hypothetical protein
VSEKTKFDKDSLGRLSNVPVLQILEDSGKILVIPVSRPAASYYPNNLIQVLGLIFQNIQHISLPNSK